MIRQYFQYLCDFSVKLKENDVVKTKNGQDYLVIGQNGRIIQKYYNYLLLSDEICHFFGSFLLTKHKNLPIS